MNSVVVHSNNVYKLFNPPIFVGFTYSLLQSKKIRNRRILFNTIKQQLENLKLILIDSYCTLYPLSFKLYQNSQKILVFNQQNHSCGFQIVLRQQC